MPSPTPEEVEVAAAAAHDEYERRAPDFGYETRPESRVAWADLPENHKGLMRASITAALIAARAVSPPSDVAALEAERDELRAEVGRLREALARARDDMEGWGGYASDYFKEKWGLADDLAAIDAALASDPADKEEP